MDRATKEALNRQIFAQLEHILPMLQRAAFEVPRLEVFSEIAVLHPLDRHCPRKCVSGFIVDAEGALFSTATRCPCFVASQRLKALVSIRALKELLIQPSLVSVLASDKLLSWNKVTSEEVAWSAGLINLLRNCAWLEFNTAGNRATENEDALGLFLLQYMLNSGRHVLLTWEDVVAMFSNAQTSEMRKRFEDFERLFNSEFAKTVVLTMMGTTLRLRSGNCPEVTAFENFVSYISGRDLGLVVNSKQELLRQKQANVSILNIDYRSNERASYRDEKNRLRFVSVKETERSESCVEDVLRAGVMDRLLEALAQGQRLIDGVSQCRI